MIVSFLLYADTACGLLYVWKWSNPPSGWAARLACSSCTTYEQIWYSISQGKIVKYIHSCLLVDRGGVGTRDKCLSQSNFFDFMQSLGKNGQNNKFTPFPLGLAKSGNSWDRYCLNTGDSKLAVTWTIQTKPHLDYLPENCFFKLKVYLLYVTCTVVTVSLGGQDPKLRQITSKILCSRKIEIPAWPLVYDCFFAPKINW